MNAIMKAFVATHVRLYRATNGKMGGSIAGRPLVLLTTTGRKTGRQITIPLASFEDGGDRLVVASANGAKSHPAWFNNLSANPEVGVQLKDKTYRAKAEAVTGEERARLWTLVITQAPGFGNYVPKAAPREIPIVRLKEIH